MNRFHLPGRAFRIGAATSAAKAGPGSSADRGRWRAAISRLAGSWRVLFWTAMLATMSAQAVAQKAPGPRREPNGVTWGELALLPEYCKDANGIVWGDAYFNRSPNATRWEALMGPDFWHVHHYCYALANLRRANAPGVDAARKKYILGKVLGDYTYMVRNSRREFPLMPEILVHIGDVQWLLGNTGDSIGAYMDAIELKPDYGPAYVQWATALESVKLRDKAIEVLDKGVRNAVAYEEVRRMYTRLTGRPVPAPVQASGPAAQPAPAAAAPESPASATE